MRINTVYKTYFQKSRVFLYPILGIKRGGSVTPIETFMTWDSHYEKNDCKLISLYHIRDDEEFKQFEKTKLLNNKYFHDFVLVGDNKGVYVFDFSSIKDDFLNVVNGKYSKLNPNIKKIIMDYTGKNNSTTPYIESFLYPERYFQLYAELMGTDIELLRNVGELCSIPDLKKEALNISIVSYELKQELY